MELTGTVSREVESQEYEACRFELYGRTVAFRVAKTTPKKLGQFVTLWKRIKPGAEIAPLDAIDGVNFVVVSASDSNKRGQFVFNQKLLITKGILSLHGEGGKRAFRVYPPWVELEAKEALRTQQWQHSCFLHTPENGIADVARVRQLFAL
jgi:hypothetical protein